MEILKNCVMVMTSAWLHDKSSCKPLGKVLEKRFEVKQTGHIGFGVNDLDADTKLVENAVESMKLNGAKRVDSPRVRRNDEQTAQIENSKKLTQVESTLYRSLVMKLAYVASKQN